MKTTSAKKLSAIKSLNKSCPTLKNMILDFWCLFPLRSLKSMILNMMTTVLTSSHMSLFVIAAATLEVVERAQTKAQIVMKWAAATQVTVARSLQVIALNMVDPSKMVCLVDRLAIHRWTQARWIMMQVNKSGTMQRTEFMVETNSLELLVSTYYQQRFLSQL